MSWKFSFCGNFLARKGRLVATNFVCFIKTTFDCSAGTHFLENKLIEGKLAKRYSFEIVVTLKFNFRIQ
jgi:hypothetical protein